MEPPTKSRRPPPALSGLIDSYRKGNRKKMASALRTTAIGFSASSRRALLPCCPSRSLCNFPCPPSRNFYRPLCASSSPSSVSANASSAATGVPSDTAVVRAAAEALDIRVGRVLKAWKHPEADSLFVEEVDVGEPDPRIICSGLVKYVSQDELQGRNVVVLANLKARNFRGVKSNGMLMAASDAAHENVELLTPPEGAVPGERIWFGFDEEINNQSEPASASQVQKKKIWETVQPHLKTTGDCVAVLGEKPMRTSAGLVSCKSLQNANIS